MSRARFEEAVDVAAPAEAAWDVLVDYDLDAAWRAEVVSMTPTPPGPAAVGTRTLEVARVLGSTFETPGEVVALEPGTSLRWRASSAALDAAGERLVEPIGAAACRVVLRYDLAPKGATRLAWPILVRVFRRGVRKNLRTLAALVYERSASASSRAA